MPKQSAPRERGQLEKRKKKQKKKKKKKKDKENEEDEDEEDKAEKEDFERRRHYCVASKDGHELMLLEDVNPDYWLYALNS